MASARGGLASTATLALLLLGPTFQGSACRRPKLARSDAASVVVVAPGRDAAQTRRTPEREPNDSPEQAQQLILDADWPVIDVEGTLSSASDPTGGKDVDVFKLQIPGTARGPEQGHDGASPAEDPRRTARRLNLELGPDQGASLALQVLDDQLRVLETVNAEDGQPAGMPDLAAQPGHTYYFRVKALAKPGKGPGTASSCKYKLSVQLADFDAADEREPNDSLETAEDVVMTGMAELSGYLGWQHDQDFYRLRGPDVLSALEVRLDGVEGVATQLQVLAGNGSRLAMAKGRRGEALALHNVSIAPAVVDAGPELSSFYVVVRSEAGQNRNQRYVLHLSLGGLKQDSEIEPNDVPANASLLRDGITTGFLPAGDVDYFSYDSSEPRELTIEIDFPAHERAKVELSRASKTESIAMLESKKPHQQAFISGVATLGERLLLRIAPVKGDGNPNDPYTIKVSSSPSPGEAHAPQIRLSP